LTRTDGTLDWNATLAALKSDESYIDAINDYARGHLRSTPAICMRIFRKALDFAAPQKRYRTVGWCNYWLGYLMQDRGELDLALDHHLESLRALELAEDDFGARRAKNAVAVDYRHLGMFDAALEWTLETLSDSESAQDSPLRASALSSLGDLHMKLGQLDEAEKALKRAAEEQLTPQSRLHLVIGFSELRNLEGNYSEAQDRANEALALATDSQVKHYYADALMARARARHGLWRLDEARQDAEAAMQESKELRDRRAIAEGLLLKGKIIATSGDFKLAFKTLRRALIFAERTKSLGVQAAVHAEISRIAKQRGKYKRAYEHYETFHHIYETQYSEKIQRTLARFRSEISRRETKAYDRIYEKVEAIANIGQDISENADIEDALERIYRQVNQLMDASTFGIAAYDEETDLLEYRILIVEGDRVPERPVVRIHDLNTFGGYCLRRNEVIVMNDLYSEYGNYIRDIDKASLHYDERLTHSAIYLPLSARGKLVGLLTVQSFKKNAYDPRVVDGLKLIGFFVALALADGPKSDATKAIGAKAAGSKAAGPRAADAPDVPRQTHAGNTKPALSERAKAGNKKPRNAKA
jgi:tetratricopeptide (TPR) repeat protein